MSGHFFSYHIITYMQALIYDKFISFSQMGAIVATYKVIGSAIFRNKLFYVGCGKAFSEIL